jgi:hypothetical protein
VSLKLIWDSRLYDYILSTILAFELYTTKGISRTGVGILKREETLNEEDLEFRGRTMEQVEEFIYLGSAITMEGKFVKDLEQRRAGARRAFGTLRRRLWERRETSLKVKMKIFNAVVLPVLLYGATAEPSRKRKGWMLSISRWEC